MGLRRRGRECALQMLYQLDITNQQKDEHQKFDFHYPAAIMKFALELVQGVLDNLGEIDTIIADASENWYLSRMSYIDRNILRLSVYEIRFRIDIPFKVSINEAIELGKKFGTDQSGKFINGILDKIVVKPELNIGEN